MVKSIVWIVVVALLLAWGIRVPLPSVFARSAVFGIYVILPYIWLLVLAIMSLIRSIRKSPTETK
jgi:hypothetical protein